MKTWDLSEVKGLQCPLRDGITGWMAKRRRREREEHPEVDNKKHVSHSSTERKTKSWVGSEYNLPDRIDSH